LKYVIPVGAVALSEIAKPAVVSAVVVAVAFFNTEIGASTVTVFVF
jgi:hypothetical protein